MANAAQHAVTVLSGILPGRRDLLEKAQARLTPAHFPEKVQSNLFAFLQRYDDVAGHVLSRTALEDLLRNKADPGLLALYLETYDLYAETEVSDAEFLWSIQELRELAADKATGEVITEAMEILTQGVRDPKTGETVKGHSEARQHLLESFSAIDMDLTQQDAPEGDMRAERRELEEDYQERKLARQSGTSLGIQFGIAELDAKLNGMQNGELILAAGYSSDGKTTLCVQAAWSAAVEQGKNVVFLTTETLRVQVRRKLIARHSKLPIFGLPEGLNTRDLKAGTLDATQEAKYKEVVADLTNNPAYGALFIAQVARTATIESIEMRLSRIQRKMNVDLVVLDYLTLLKSERPRQTVREELASIMKSAKLLATNFADGRGVPFLSPWQVSRAARENAEKLGMYTSAALSETAEATNSADVIISLLAPTDNTNRYATVSMQILKSRDSETANGLETDVDYATSWFRSKAAVGMTHLPSSSYSSAGSSNLGSLDSLI